MLTRTHSGRLSSDTRFVTVNLFSIFLSGLRSATDFEVKAEKPAASTWPESRAWMVAAMSSKSTIRASGGAIFGTVATDLRP